VDSAVIDSTLRNVRTVSANASALTDSLRLTAASLNATLARLQRGEGTAGKLLTDSLLYADVRRLVTRIDSLTLDFKKNPRRYINLEIF
jgi:phospholipid/cholesterol/gamma-HCH transport system substrate-binding protein